MAKSNRERVGEVIDALKPGLGPFVIRQYKARYRGKFLREMEMTLYNPPFSVSLPDEQSALAKVDTQGWLRLIFFKWKEAFADTLGNSERSYVSILMETRNDWAHQKPFTNDDAQHVADIARRLFVAVGAKTEAELADSHIRALRGIQADRDAGRSIRQQTAQTTAEDAAIRHTPAGLKPWREVIEPHSDVSRGRFTLSEFSADLSQVVQGKAEPEYGEPGEFFQRTYLTQGLQDLIVSCFERFNGSGGDPVVQLKTNFGGGKTHSMLAIYHLAKGIRLRDIAGAEDIVERLGEVDDYIKCQRAVIVGTAFDGTKPRDYADCSTHNLWGEIAYQLGGLKAYEMVAEADRQGISPGSDTLLALLESHGPALIIIDELVAHARNLYGSRGAPFAASFDSLMTFIQALTEGVRRASDALLLVSLPDSVLEMGGEGGQQALANISSHLARGEEQRDNGKRALDFVGKTLGRLETVWKPITPTESFEIVRRRLFSDQVDRAARDAVVKAFSKWYRKHSADFPKDCDGKDYREMLQRAYPFHPELFARLYNDWSTLEGFQRTRGVLRLMATVIHHLWMVRDQSLLIMPGNIPLWQPQTRYEILRYLPDNWPPIVDQDIDGDRSLPRKLDRDVSSLGKYSASRRVARAVFMGSAPTVRAQSVRGVEEGRILLATVQPGESPAIFSDALRRMSNQLTYLYSDGARYWYDTRPTVNRSARELAQRMDEYKARDEVARRLGALGWDRGKLGSVHFMPEDSADIPDERSARVVVLSPQEAHRRGDDNSDAIQFIKKIMQFRGSAQRHHKNMLVFIAPDATRYAELHASVCQWLAWSEIKSSEARYNLDNWQRRQVLAAIERENETVESRIQETFCWLIVPRSPEDEPAQDSESERQESNDGRNKTVFSVQRITKSANFLAGAARKLESDNAVIYSLSPDILLMELSQLNYWTQETHVKTTTLWDWLTRYVYMPRLLERAVLEAAIKEGVSRLMPAFGYATRLNDDGSYAGLKWGETPTLRFDEHELIIKPEIAQAQRQAEIAEREQSEGIILPDDRIAPGPRDPQPAAPAQPPAPVPMRRYCGSARIDAQRAMRDLSQIAAEIIEPLAALPGVKLQVSVEIQAEHADGFNEATIRSVKENSRTLKFRRYDFEA